MRRVEQFSVLLSPVISEKSTDMADRHRTIVFQVDKQATKSQVKEAVEKIFEVKVEKVGVVNVPGKVKRFKGHKGQRSSTKKAYVVLKAGHDINFAELN